MSHTYTSCLFHVVFSTKARQDLIQESVRERLWPYIIGIAKNNGFEALAVGGTANHLHALIAIPASLPVSKAVQLIKGGSSKWIHETFPEMGAFACQEGYGAFSIGVSARDDTIAYIRNQEEHHRTKSFDEEYLAFLRRHNIAFDDRYVLG